MRIKTLLLKVPGLLLAYIVSTGCTNAQATRTWVSGVGDDANPCSRTAPCKTFAGAISKTAAGGEIDCLDPGGFGALTITKSLTIDCTGTFGSILVAGTNGIVVAAGVNDKVILRGIRIDGTNTGINGIRFLGGAQLSVEGVFITGFTATGIDINKTAAAEVYVRNAYITNTGKGIVATTTVPVTTVQVDDSSILNVNGNGIEAQANIIVTITNTTLSSAANAVIATGGSQINVDTSTLINNGTAVNASVAGSTIRVSNNKIYNNGTNFNIAGGATIASTGNNRITGGGGMAPNATVTQQ